MEENSGLTAYFYSVTDDLLEQIRVLKSKFGIRVNFSTLKNPVSEKELASIFANSRVYIGCSISDGVSTSFLEALTKGVYPIQTNTSCAGEWVDKGAIASLVPLNLDSIKFELEKAVFDNTLVDKASECNLSVANEYLRFEHVSAKAKVFYQ